MFASFLQDHPNSSHSHPARLHIQAVSCLKYGIFPATHLSTSKAFWKRTTSPNPCVWHLKAFFCALCDTAGHKPLAPEVEENSYRMQMFVNRKGWPLENCWSVLSKFSFSIPAEENPQRVCLLQGFSLWFGLVSQDPDFSSLWIHMCWEKLT